MLSEEVTYIADWVFGVCVAVILGLIVVDGVGLYHEDQQRERLMKQSELGLSLIHI